jgi:thiosulfate reductase cytochrome b subunit
LTFHTPSNALAARVVKLVTATKKAVAAVIIILFLSMVKPFSLPWLENYVGDWQFHRSAFFHSLGVPPFNP